MTNVLPYLHRYRDRHGKIRWYFRPAGGGKQIALPDPKTPNFAAAYQAARDGQPARVEIGSTHTKPGTFDAAAVSYYASTAFANLAPGTRRMRRAVIEAFRRDHGSKRIVLLERRHISEMVATKAAKAPAAARNFLAIMRALMQHCVAIGMLDADPTVGVKSVKVRTSGIYTWSEADISAYRMRHSIGGRPRLALELLLGTGQRRGDVIRMGRQHIRDGAIHITQRKTGAALVIPIHPDLAAAIETTPCPHLTFLVTRDGSPFSDAGFGNAFRAWCEEAELPKQCSAHGLRKAACRRLAEAGCSALEIMSISGHVSLREVQRYCAAADQARMARTAMASVTTAFSSAENGADGEHKLANQGVRLANRGPKLLKGNG